MKNRPPIVYYVPILEIHLTDGLASQSLRLQ
jgi:hypothetical protein